MKQALESKAACNDYQQWLHHRILDLAEFQRNINIDIIAFSAQRAGSTYVIKVGIIKLGILTVVGELESLLCRADMPPSPAAPSRLLPVCRVLGWLTAPIIALLAPII